MPHPAQHEAAPQPVNAQDHCQGAINQNGGGGGGGGGGVLGKIPLQGHLVPDNAQRDQNHVHRRPVTDSLPPGHQAPGPPVERQEQPHAAPPDRRRGGHNAGAPQNLPGHQQYDDDDINPPDVPMGMPTGPPPRGAIVKPTDLDILLGRGRPFHLHPGNQKMHRIVEQYKPEYLRSRRLDKVQIAIIIVRELQDAGGRFLKKDDKLIYWYPVHDSAARKKVSHLLRERPNKAQREVADARVRAAAEAAKIPPVADEAVEVNRDGNPVVPPNANVPAAAPSARNVAPVAPARAPVPSNDRVAAPPNPPPTHPSNPMPPQPNMYGNQHPGLAGPLPPHQMQIHAHPYAGSYPNPYGMPGQYGGYGANHLPTNAAAAHSALLADYHHHRSMLDHHIRQLAKHPFHTSPGAKPFEMPPLPPDLVGPAPAPAVNPAPVVAPPPPTVAPAPAPVARAPRAPALAQAPSAEAQLLNGAPGLKIDEEIAVNSIAKAGERIIRKSSRSPPSRPAADPPGERFASSDRKKGPVDAIDTSSRGEEKERENSLEEEKEKAKEDIKNEEKN